MDLIQKHGLIPLVRSTPSSPNFSRALEATSFPEFFHMTSISPLSFLLCYSRQRGLPTLCKLTSSESQDFTKESTTSKYQPCLSNSLKTNRKCSVANSTTPSPLNLLQNETDACTRVNVSIPHTEPPAENWSAYFASLSLCLLQLATSRTITHDCII